MQLTFYKAATNNSCSVFVRLVRLFPHSPSVSETDSNPRISQSNATKRSINFLRSIWATAKTSASIPIRWQTEQNTLYSFVWTLLEIKNTRDETNKLCLFILFWFVESHFQQQNRQIRLIRTVLMTTASVVNRFIYISQVNALQCSEHVL